MWQNEALTGRDREKSPIWTTQVWGRDSGCACGAVRREGLERPRKGRTQGARKAREGKLWGHAMDLVEEEVMWPSFSTGLDGT